MRATNRFSGWLCLQLLKYISCEVWTPLPLVLPPDFMHSWLPHLRCTCWLHSLAIIAGREIRCMSRSWPGWTGGETEAFVPGPSGSMSWQAFGWLGAMRFDGVAVCSI